MAGHGRGRGNRGRGRGQDGNRGRDRGTQNGDATRMPGVGGSGISGRGPAQLNTTSAGRASNGGGYPPNNTNEGRQVGGAFNWHAPRNNFQPTNTPANQGNSGVPSGGGAARGLSGGAFNWHAPRRNAQLNNTPAGRGNGRPSDDTSEVIGGSMNWINDRRGTQTNDPPGRGQSEGTFREANRSLAQPNERAVQEIGDEIRPTSVDAARVRSDGSLEGLHQNQDIPRDGGGDGGGVPHGSHNAQDFDPPGSSVENYSSNNNKSSLGSGVLNNPVSLDDSIGDAKGELIRDIGGLAISTGMPRRPGLGVQGKGFHVRANSFEVEVPDYTMFVYRVTIEPPVFNRDKKKRLYKLLEDDPAFKPLVEYTASDYAERMVSTKQLNSIASSTMAGRNADGLKIAVKLSSSPALLQDDNDKENEKPTDKDQYTFTIQRTHEIDLSILGRYVNGGQEGHKIADVYEAFQALNLLIARHAHRNPSLIALGHDKYFPLRNANTLYKDVGAGLTARKGFYSSIRPTRGLVLLNVNVSTAVFYQGGNLTDVIDNFLATQRQEYLKKFLSGLTVTASYRNTFRKQTIEGLHTEKPSKVDFYAPDKKTKANKMFNVRQFFKEEYSIALPQPERYNAIILKGSNGKNCVVPAEVLTVAPGQLFKGQLSHTQSMAMIEFSNKKPKQNSEIIEGEGLRHLGVGMSSSARLTGASKISISKEMVTIPARLLEPPAIIYSNGRLSGNKIRGFWNLSGQLFARDGCLNEWAVLVVWDERLIPEKFLSEELEKFTKICNKAGMFTAKYSHIAEVRLCKLRDTKLIKEHLRDGFGRVAECKVKAVLVLLAVTPEKDAAVYSAIKYTGDIVYGITTVCSIWKKFSKSRGQEQYMANLALKFNLKLGGINHRIHQSNLGILSRKKVMVVGADVTHSSPGGSRSAPSIASVVASIDQDYSCYPCSLRLQPPSKHEMIASLEEMMTERLHLWARKNGGAYPDHILFYRDGVSEGEFDKVRSEELPLIQAALSPANLKGARVDYSPKITLCTVGKRHHTRFYPNEMDSSITDRKNGNPFAGLVVDRGVTTVDDFDFFLQAHQGIQGQARPAHYVVLHDDNKFSADDLQMLTHTLCYQFGRATRSVSYCPPAYYADLACERGRCYIYELFNDRRLPPAPLLDRSKGRQKGGQRGEQKGDPKDKSNKPSEEEKNASFHLASKLWAGGVHKNLRETMFYL